MAHVSGDATVASTMPTAASIRATAAGDLIQASPCVQESAMHTAASIRATAAGDLIRTSGTGCVEDHRAVLRSVRNSGSGHHTLVVAF